MATSHGYTMVIIVLLVYATEINSLGDFFSWGGGWLLVPYALEPGLRKAQQEPSARYGMPTMEHAESRNPVVH